MKLNNKGITLVEVIVSFALLMIILVGLFNIIMEVKSDVTDKQMEKEFKDFDNLMIARIQGDLIKNKATSCDASTDKKSVTCKSSNGDIVITIDNGKIIYKDPKTKLENAVTYEIPYKDNEGDIFQYPDTNGVDIKDNILKISFIYSYVDGTKKFGFTIVHPLTNIE